MAESAELTEAELTEAELTPTELTAIVPSEAEFTEAKLTLTESWTHWDRTHWGSLYLTELIEADPGHWGRTHSYGTQNSYWQDSLNHVIS